MKIPRAKLVLPFSVLLAALLFGALLIVTAPEVESTPPDRALQMLRTLVVRPPWKRVSEGLAELGPVELGGLLSARRAFCRVGADSRLAR